MIYSRYLTDTAFNWVLPKGRPKLYQDYYSLWFDYLSERCINIFKWNGLPFKQRFLELYLQGCGYCGLTKLSNSDNKYDALICSMSGVTNYATEFTTALGTTPSTQTLFHIYGSSAANPFVQQEGIIADNNQTRSPLIPLIDYYANMLAHLDLSIQKVAIKLRVQGFIKGTDSDAVKSITEWYTSVEDGKSLGVLDENLFGEMTQGIIAQPLGTAGASELSELLLARHDYITAFWSDIGVNVAEEKKERLLSSEIVVGFNRVQFNVSDMIESREETADNIYKLYGDRVTVELNPKLSVDLSHSYSDLQ